MDELLAKSQQLKSEADSIIADSHLIDILSEYGVPHITGSYPLDVMVRPDLDFYVVTGHESLPGAISVMNKILVTDYFDSTWFVNRSGMALTTSIQGFYLQPRKKLGDHEWKLDVWLVREDQYKAYTANFLERLNALEDPQIARNRILQLKSHFRSGTKYRGKVDGRRMYELVLDNPEKTFEELLPLAEALA